MNRAYALLEIKSIDDDARTFEGIASTPSIDKGGDIMDPMGAEFTLPMPLLWQHGLRDIKDPVGWVTAATPNKNGIPVKGKFAKVDSPPSLKEDLDRVWALVKEKLVRGLSIGWSGIESAPGKNGVVVWKKWGWHELSAVTIPMNTEASITSIKSIDQALLAASGEKAERPVVRLNTSPGASGSKSKGKAMKTIQEQISAMENKRAASVARREEIQSKAIEEGRSKEEAEKQEFDTLSAEISTIDSELVDLKLMEKQIIAKAAQVNTVTQHPNAKAASGNGGDDRTFPTVRVTPNQPKGTAFTRMVQCLGIAKGDSYKAMEHAKVYRDSPEVELMVKAAVAAGTTTDATWAGPLVTVQPLVNEFLELLRPMTLIGRIPGLRQVPFNVSVPSQTGGGTYNWVGQGLPKPVTAAAFATVLVPFAKAAGIIVLTEELIRLSTPSAEATVRTEMINGMQQFLDGQFITVAVAAVANLNPASITNGATAVATLGATGTLARQDAVRAVAAFTAANIPLEGSVWIMSSSNAFALSIALNALSQPLFPGMTPMGGTLLGMPVIVSNTAAALVVLVHAPSILFADEGGVRIDVSREASVQMSDAPEPAPAVYDAALVNVSLWQNNLVGIRAERMITWIRARAAAVHVTTGAAYTGA